MFATIENMEKVKDRRDVVAYSPYTGEEYSANWRDYHWQVPAGWRMRDSTRHVMRLVTKTMVIEEIE